MSSQGDLYDVSDNEEQVRPLSISKRQGYAQPGNRVSVISNRQLSMAPANGNDEGSLRPLSIGRRGRNIRAQCVSNNVSTRPSSVHNEKPDDVPTPHAESSAPSLANEAHGETKPFAKQSVSDIRKTFEGVPNNNDRSLAAQKSRIPRRQPSGAPQVNEGSTKLAANIQPLSRAPLHSATMADDQYPDEGARTPRQPHFQGSMRDVLGKPDQEKMAPHRSFKAGSSSESPTPVNEEAGFHSKRRLPRLCRSQQPTINHETYDALHGRRTANITPVASPRPSPSDTIGPHMGSAAGFCHPSRPVFTPGKAVLQHEDKGACISRASCIPNPNYPRGDAHGPGRDSAASSRRPTCASCFDNIDDEIDAQFACSPQKEVEEHASCRLTVAISLQSSHAPSVHNPGEEIEAQYAHRALSEEKQPVMEQGSNPDSAESSLRMSRVLHNLDQEVKAEYAHPAAIEQKQAEEHQSCRYIVVSPQRSSRTFLTDDIETEIEAEYVRRKQKETGEQQARSESASSSRRSSRVPNDDYIEKQIKAKYAHCAQKEAEEQQSRRSSVASFRSSSEIPAISIEEVEALYARPPAGYQNQVPQLDGDGEATSMALPILLSPSSKAPAASSRRSPISPRFDYQENQFPEYTAPRNSIRARCCSRSSSRGESNIHPAFRDKPYFSPSSPHHETRAESLGQRGTETRSGSSTNSRKCSAMDSLCSECRNVLKAIRPNVSDRYLECPPNIHPVIVECLLTGTSDDAIAIVRNLHKRIIRYTTRPFYLHAAVRRSAISGRKSGHCYDITTEGLPHSRACSTSRHYDNKGPGTIQKVFYSPYSWAKKQEKKKQKHIKKTHVKLRDIQILMDFPWQIERPGMIEKKISDSLPKNVKLTKLEHISVHHALHRLEWWARAHPIHHHTTETSREYGESSRSREREPNGYYHSRPSEYFSKKPELDPSLSSPLRVFFRKCHGGYHGSRNSYPGTAGHAASYR